MKYAYAIWRINKYPECHEPSEIVESIFTHKREFEKARKKLEKTYPVLYSLDNFRIEKIKLNKLGELTW